MFQKGGTEGLNQSHLINIISNCEKFKVILLEFINKNKELEMRLIDPL